MNRPPMFTRDTRGPPVGVPMYTPDTRGRPPNVPMFTPDTRGRPSNVPMFTPDTRGRPSNVPMFTPDTRGRPSNVPNFTPDTRGLLALASNGMQDRNGTAPDGTGGDYLRNGPVGTGGYRQPNGGETTTQNPAFYPGFQSLLADQVTTGFGGARKDNMGLLGQMFQPTQQRQPFQITDGTGGDYVKNGDGLTDQERMMRESLAKNEYIIAAKQGRFPTITTGIDPRIQAELDRIRNGGQ